MNDKEKLIEMFNRQGIKFEETNTGALVVEAGYVGFQTWFEFNADNSLKSIEAYE
jgi:hypothetical protein